MGHNIRGFIASYDALSLAAQSLPHARVCRLQLGYGFLPVTSDVAPSVGPAADLPHVDRLTAPLASWAAEASRRCPIAYVQTDYFGGAGSQCAVVWAANAIVFGPTETGDSQGSVTPLLEGAINRAVRHLGVERGEARDEFEALGLNLHRNNRGWVGSTG